MLGSSRKKLQFVDLFYAISIIQVVFVHARMMRIDNTDFIKSIVDFIDDYHMSLFFFLAGVLLSYTDYRHNDIGKWYVDKVKKLAFPFLLLTFLAYIPKILLEPLLENGASFSFDYLLRILFIPRKTIWGHFWFIPVYLVLILLSKLYIRCRENKLLSFGILLSSFILNFTPIRIEWFGISDVCKYAFYILLGVMIEPIVLDTYHNCEKKIKIVCLITCVILAGFSYQHSNYTLILKLHIIVMIMIVTTISMILEDKELKLFRLIGKNNLVIYIYSWPIQSVIEILMTRFTSSDYYLVLFCKFVFGLSAPLLIKKIADRYVNNITIKEITGLK